MASPDEASEMACPMVLQAVVSVRQLLPSLPFTPSTYHVVWARAFGARARNKATSRNAVIFDAILVRDLIGLSPLGKSEARLGGGCVPWREVLFGKRAV